ncbi:MAG: hypothetical protein WBX22_11585 [Silvibacterium sp.]
MARMQTRIGGGEAESAATVELLGGDSFEDCFAMLEREEQMEALSPASLPTLWPRLRSELIREINDSGD